MDPVQIKQAWDWGGWPAVFFVVFVALAKWYCDKKLAQDAKIAEKRMELEEKYHNERMAEAKATQEMLGYLAEAVSSMVFKSMNMEEGVKVMSEISKRRVESARASARVESHPQ
jgi:hypothetical protein